MIDPTQNIPIPIDPSFNIPEEASLSTTFDPGEKIYDSPFAKMFPDGATRQEIQRFIDQAMYMIALEIKRSNERWKKSQKRLRDVIEGRRPTEY